MLLQLRKNFICIPMYADGLMRDPFGTACFIVIQTGIRAAFQLSRFALMPGITVIVLKGSRKPA